MQTSLLIREVCPFPSPSKTFHPFIEHTLEGPACTAGRALHEQPPCAAPLSRNAAWSFPITASPAPGARWRILQLTFVLRPLGPAADRLTGSQLSWGRQQNTARDCQYLKFFNPDFSRELMSFHQGSLHQEGHIHVLWTGVTFFVSRRVVSFPLFFFLFFSFFNLHVPWAIF